jgi:hypothetical protein
MNKGQLALNLATSITQGAWSKDTIVAVLERRLPPRLRKFSNGLGTTLLEQLPRPYAPSPKCVQAVLVSNLWFERVFAYCQKQNVWPAPDITSPVMAPTKAFSYLELPELPTLAALADWLLLPLDRLVYLADIHDRHEEHGETAVNHYHYVLKPKKSDGFRLIEAPKEQLKAVQRQILTGILDRVPVHQNAFGFVKERNCLDGANRHAGEQVVVCFDLKDFFPSIRRARIFGLFRCLGYPYNVATFLAALCTTVTPSRILGRLSIDERAHYNSAHLPQGSPVSPALANHAAFTLDTRLTALANTLDANFSRYADDVSFSGDKHIANLLMRAVPEIVRDEGFHLNTKKTRVNTSTTRQVVTGIVVNQHLNIRRQTFDELKAIIHACAKPEDLRLNDPTFRASLLGRLDWVEQVNPLRGRKLMELLTKALSRSGL